ncbi:MAG: ExbD/TolR family protein [Phycisphaerae bacterium]
MLRSGFDQTRGYVPNLAPMVDVVMVILVFFMLGTSLAITEGVLPTKLPTQIGPGGAAEVAVVPTVRILLREAQTEIGCQILIMDTPLSENSFKALQGLLRAKRLAGADPDGPILIGAEPGVVYQAVISTMDACVRAGFHNIQFSVNPGVTPQVE